ncbi:hypothetical protein [Sporanaerobacter acetigenes]|uniref:Uncharacterized protein n=1 Tax=Sporanaerobacter acetigenes DSM 13106 TaxID=1123281 RepID=A0A1M5UP46_9FIRM|nr:hypothetical protein [Sporanaerobacter acetigenes]SHH64731.1 hypothetical protein SAMN02745180_00714 [Sporanaerobacter acetigenes DSM 13106]
MVLGLLITVFVFAFILMIFLFVGVTITFSLFAKLLAPFALIGLGIYLIDKNNKV